jgi:hypothetical protein
MTNHLYGPKGHIVDAFLEHLKGDDRGRLACGLRRM